MQVSDSTKRGYKLGSMRFDIDRRAFLQATAVGSAALLRPLTLSAAGEPSNWNPPLPDIEGRVPTHRRASREGLAASRDPRPRSGAVSARARAASAALGDDEEHALPPVWSFPGSFPRCLPLSRTLGAYAARECFS